MFGLTLLKGHPKRPNRLILEEPIKLQHLLFSFDLDRSQTHGWQNADGSKFMITNQMAEYCVKLLIDYIRRQELGNRAD